MESGWRAIVFVLGWLFARPCASTDNQFGDQHLKEAVTLWPPLTQSFCATARRNS
jgi:hypothetical protein